MARKVTPFERELWNRVAVTTSRGLVEPSKNEVVVETPLVKTKFKPPKFEIGSHAERSTSWAQSKKPSSPIDTKALSKLRRGKTVPEAKIDLHGMTQAEALPALTQFLLRCSQRNFRMVLVITGKGKEKESFGPIPERVGVLKQNLPNWITRPPLNSVVQGSIQAHQKHGGSGAFYIYLKRFGK